MSYRKSDGVRTDFSPVPRGRGPLLTSVFPILYHKVVFAGLRVLNRACVANPPTLPCPLAGSRGRAGPGGGDRAPGARRTPTSAPHHRAACRVWAGEAAVKISGGFRPERRGEEQERAAGWCVGSVPAALPLTA